MTELPLRLEGMRQWLDRAFEDLRAARYNRDGEFYRAALFFCQQSVEKALKGFLTLHDVPFPKSHSIAALIDLAEPLDPALREVLAPAESLTIYAVAMRYPGAPYEPDETETDAVLATAEAVFAALSRRMPRR